MSINSQIERLELAKADLFQAITAKGGVLTASQSISDYAAAVNGIEINTGSDIDFTGVTVTADKLLSGVVAVNASGVKVTGTIQTVTASMSDNVVTVPKGYIAEQQTFNAGVILPTVSVTANKLLSGVTAINSNGATVTGTIPTVTASMSDNVVTVPSGHIASAQTLTVAEMSEPTVSKNVVTITKGYNKTQKTVTIPLATITETETQVSIGVGYVSEAKTYNLSSGSVPAEFGYLNTDGTIQLYDFSVTPPTDKGTSVSAELVTVLPRPYDGEITEGEYLRFTAVEDSTIQTYGKNINKTFSLTYRKNSGYWIKAVADEVIPLKAGEYVEFYGNYQGTTIFNDLFDEVFGDTTVDDTSDEALSLGFTGKLQGSGYLNSISDFKTTLTKGDYRLLLLDATTIDIDAGGQPALISSPIIPKMTAVFNGKTKEFPFGHMIGAPLMNEITVAFTDWNGAEEINWCQVAETGVFRKPAALPTIFGERDKDGVCTYIPPNWTVENI